MPHPRTHQGFSEQDVPRGHDVRAVGQPDHDESIHVIHRALDAGINLIDTSDSYSLGESEEIVGKALAGGRRDNVVLAIKVCGAMGRNRTSGAAPGDHIDLYQVRQPDRRGPAGGA